MARLASEDEDDDGMEWWERTWWGTNEKKEEEEEGGEGEARQEAPLRLHVAPRKRRRRRRTAAEGRMGKAGRRHETTRRKECKKGTGDHEEVDRRSQKGKEETYERDFPLDRTAGYGDGPS